MKPLDLPSLIAGTRVQDTLLVLEVNRRTTSDGNPFTVLTVGNATGRIDTEPFWLDRAELVAGVHRGHVAQVIGEVEAYRERRQLKVSSLRVIPAGSVDVRGLLPAVTGIERYWETLDAWRSEIRKPRLRGAVDLFFQDAEFRRSFEQCPASIRGHHAALGGLLKHTTEVAAIARTIARTSPADPELVLAGALLHDIGKIESYSWEGLFDLTETGRLVGHVTQGALMLERRMSQAPAPACTDLERQILTHLILSHHGRLELGSPVRPMMLEAEIVHWADNASASTAAVAQAIGDSGNFPGGPVSSPVPQLDGRRVFRGQSDWGA